MILIDTSAWVEFLRDTGSGVCEYVNIALEGDFATCDEIWMELLAGTRNVQHLNSLRRLLSTATQLPTYTAHYEEAALLFLQCKSEENIKCKLPNCLIAAVAIEADVPVLHSDEDFDVLERNSQLRNARFFQRAVPTQ